MICIECGNPVQTLYTSYSPSNIRLTACPQCNKFADKYIEYDNVLIFIDLLLLRPQAYRHMVYNTLSYDGVREEKEEVNSSSVKSSSNGGKDQKISKSKRPVFALHPKTVRFFILITLFDVYLTWAKAERETLNAAPATAAPAAFFFKRLPVLGQYLNFLFFCLTDTLLFYFLIYCLAVLVSRFLSNARTAKDSAKKPWTPKSESSDSSLSEPSTASELKSILTQQLPPKPTTVAAAPLITALIISSSSKLFPILMVIWSYDVPVAANILAWAVSFNTVEALRIVLDCGYAEALVITAAAEAARISAIRPALMTGLQEFWQFIGF